MKFTNVEILIVIAIVVLAGLAAAGAWHDIKVERPIRYEVWCRMRGGDAPAVSYEEWIIAVDKPRQEMLNARLNVSYREEVVVK